MNHESRGGIITWIIVTASDHGNCTTEKLARQPCLPASLLSLPQNTRLPHATRLKSFRNHISKSPASIYCNRPAYAQRIHLQPNRLRRRSHVHSSQSDMGMDGPIGFKGSGMTRTSFFVIFVGNYYRSDICSPALDLEAE